MLSPFFFSLFLFWIRAFCFSFLVIFPYLWMDHAIINWLSSEKRTYISVTGNVFLNISFAFTIYLVFFVRHANCDYDNMVIILSIIRRRSFIRNSFLNWMRLSVFRFVLISRLSLLVLVCHKIGTFRDFISTYTNYTCIYMI